MSWSVGEWSMAAKRWTWSSASLKRSMSPGPGSAATGGPNRRPTRRSAPRETGFSSTITCPKPKRRTSDRAQLRREKLERPQRAAFRYMHEIGIGLEDIDAAGAARDGHILRAVAFPRHRLTDDPGRRLKLPDNVAVIRICRDELARERSSEDEAALGSERARPVRALEAGLPSRFAGQGVDRL